MDVGAIAVLVAGTGLLGIVVWVLAKIGQLLIKVVEVLAGAAVAPGHCGNGSAGAVRTQPRR